MAGDTTSTHDFLALGNDTDEDFATKPSMLDKPEIKPGHKEPRVPSAPAKGQNNTGQHAARTAVAAGAGAAVATAATKAAGQQPPTDQASRNQAAYQKLKADRAQARAEKHKQRSKKKDDPLEAKLTNIEKEKDDISEKYAEGSGSGMAVLVIACLVLLAVCGVMFYLHGDQIVETFKTTPWFRYVFLAVAMYSYANSKY